MLNFFFTNLKNVRLLCGFSLLVDENTKKWYALIQSECIFSVYCGCLKYSSCDYDRHTLLKVKQAEKMKFLIDKVCCVPVGSKWEGIF